MTDTFTIKDVTRDLGFMLSLTNLFEADDEGYWFDAGRKERFVYKLDGNDAGREIVIFQDPMPSSGVYFFNPFSEGFGKKTPATTLYYRCIRLAINNNIRTVAEFMIQSLLDVKEAREKDTEYSLSHMLTRMSSVPIDRKQTVYDVVDEKLVDEFKKIFDRLDENPDVGILHVNYLRAQMTARVKIGAFSDPQWDEKYGDGIRKRSLLAFKATLMGILGINRPEETEQFTVKYDPELKTAAEFYSTMSVYLKLYSRFNDVLEDAYGTDKFVVDLSEFTAVLERFPLSYTIAKHMVQTVLPSTAPTSTGTVNTGHLSIGNGSQPRFSGVATSRFAPEIVDSFGRQVQDGGQLNIGSGNGGSRRFAPEIIPDRQIDPFAPSIASNMQSGLGSGLGFGGGIQPSSGYGFGNQSQGGFGGGLNFNNNAPSNFGAPATRRYFG